MLPQTHKIISEHVYNNVKNMLDVDLNKGSLIYGSIKPDISYGLFKIGHFKPQSFDFICNEINDLSNYNFQSNREFIKLISYRIGVVTHFISDFFCVPHNDRATYKDNFFEHFKYESRLHKLFKFFDETVDLSKDCFILDNNKSESIKNFIDTLHLQYEQRGESLLNDLKSSIAVSSMVGLFILHNTINKNIIVSAA